MATACTPVALGRPAAVIPGVIECDATNAGVRLGVTDARVHVFSAGRQDALVAEGDLRQPISVPPGRYDVRVFFARARDRPSAWLRDVAVSPGERVSRQVAFSAGHLIVKAVVGAGRAGDGRVSVYLFKPSDHDTVVTSVAAGERILVSAGSYDLRVVLSVESREKEVRWLRDVPVTRGLETERWVEFRRGALLIRARNAGSELPLEAVTLHAYRAGDAQEEVIESGLAGVPLTLPTGRYDVRATFAASSDKPSRWVRDVEIPDGSDVEATVEFSSGSIRVQARLAGDQPLERFQAYVYYYRTGDHRQAVAYTPAGEPAVLESGRYDLRVSFFRSQDRPDVWLRGVGIAPGKAVKETVVFASGRLLVRAWDDEGGELVGDTVFVRVYSAGERTRPIASARSGEAIVLGEGVYDVQAEDTRIAGRDAWLEAVRVRAGALAEYSVTFDTPVSPSR